jgi:hypothetical protein
MVNFRNLSTIANKAKDAVEKRGGTDSLKQDAEQLKGIAKGPGSLTDKAKAAAQALKQPGGEPKAEGAAADTAKPTPKQAAGKAKAESKSEAERG